MHEIQMIPGNVAALSEPTIPRFVPRRLVEAEITRSLAMIRKDLSAHRGEFSPMLLKTCQHCEIALIQHRTAVPLDVAAACTLLLCGSSVLRHGGIGKEKRQGAADKDKVFHGDLCAMLAPSTARTLGQGPQAIEISRDGEIPQTITRLIRPSSKHSLARRSRAMGSIRCQF